MTTTTVAESHKSSRALSSRLYPSVSTKSRLGCVDTSVWPGVYKPGGAVGGTAADTPHSTSVTLTVAGLGSCHHQSQQPPWTSTIC
ncbi:MAG: hypothetical protein WDW36_007857 [Sanguina aurantia]